MPPDTNFLPPPLYDTHLVAERELIHQEVPTRVRQRGELNGASQLKLSDQQIFSTIISRPVSTLIRQIGKAFSSLSTPLGLVTVRLYVAVRFVTVRLCAAAGSLPRLVRRKVAMLRAFTVGFKKVLRVVFYLSWLCPV